MSGAMPKNQSDVGSLLRLLCFGLCLCRGVAQTFPEACAARADGLILNQSINIMATKDTAWLAQLDNIVALVRQTGLVTDKWKRDLYGEEKQYCIPELASTGSVKVHPFAQFPGMYQIPQQISCALTHLATLDIKSFVEVGCWTGWTGLFMSALLRKASGAANFASAGLDVIDARNNCIKGIAKRMGHNLYLKKQGLWQHGELEGMDSLWKALPQKVDLCFIDGGHSYRALASDVRAFMPHCKYIMLHDMVDRDAPGVVRVWRDLSSRFHTKHAFTCVHQPAGVTQRLGIGVVRVDYGELAQNGTVPASAGEAQMFPWKP